MFAKPAKYAFHGNVTKGLRSFSQPSYIHCIGKEPLKYLTIGRLLEYATSKFPEREAVISRYQQQRLTYVALLQQADKLAAGLQKLGAEKGDRVGLWAPNITEWVVAKMACARAGLIMVALNPAYEAKEMEFCINKVKMKMLICSHKTKKTNFYEILSKVTPNLCNSEPGKLKCSNIPSLQTIVVAGDETLRGVFNYNEVINMADKTAIARIEKIQHLIQPDDPCNIQFSSGTTGTPKAALLSHFNIVNNSYQIGKRNELAKAHEKICVQVPLFHAFGLTITLCSAVCFGATLVLPSPTYNSYQNLQTASEEKCTIIHGTPTMYVDLINIQKQQMMDIKAKVAVIGGSPCSPELVKQIKKYLQLKKVKLLYGLTEGTAVSFQNLPEDEDEYKQTETVGYVGDHLEVKVVDQDNNVVPFGVPGELWIRGYGTMLGYWKDYQKTKETVGPDGWLKTGDQFVLQEDGYGKVVGRLKDMIVRGGENIFPAEIENFLNQHPDIMESSVIGLPHERLGEEVCACVRLQPGATLTHENLTDFCKGQVAAFKIPSKLKVLSDFPKTTSGKVQKHLLREMVLKS